MARSADVSGTQFPIRSVSRPKANRRGRTRRRAVGLAVLFLAVAGSEQVMACAACGCTLSKDWLGPQAGAASGWSAGVSYDYINQDQARTGTRNLSLQDADAILNPAGNTGNETEVQTATRTTTFQLDYNAEGWGVSIQLPFVDRYHTTYQAGLADQSNFNFNQYDALGDLRVLGKFAVSSDGRFGLVGGVKLPTGVTNEQFNGAPGGQIDPSLQPGTGSTDVIAGAYYGDGSGMLGWFAQGTLQHTVSAQYGYTPGNAVTVNAGLRYGGMGHMFTPLLQLNLVHREKDTGSLVNIQYDGTPLTGGNLAYVAPGVAVQLPEGFSAYAYLQLPIYQNVSGVQLVAKYIASAGVRKNF